MCFVSQYLYTIYPLKIRMLVCFRSYISIFWFPISFHLIASNNNDLFCYNFVVRNVLCQSIIIYNIALKNTDFGVLKKSSKRFLISIFFQSGHRGGGGGTIPPPCPTPSPLRASNEGFALAYYNSPPLPPSPGVPSYYMAFWQKTICWYNQSLKWLRIQ